MPARRSAPHLLSVAVALVGLLAVGDADAQKAKPKAPPKKPAAAAPAAATSKETGPKETAPKAGAKPAATPKGGAAAPKGPDAEASTGKETKESKEGKGEGVKAYRFEELEIEGRLKSPQIVYFLRRVRAEFAAGDLGHRSFFPELSDSRNDPNL